MTLTQPSKCDWFRIIVDLERAGFSHRKIGRAIGQHRQSVLALKNGLVAEPKYTPGLRLVALWVRATGRVESDLPRETVGNLDRASLNTQADSIPKEHSHACEERASPDAWRCPDCGAGAFCPI